MLDMAACFLVCGGEGCVENREVRGMPTFCAHTDGLYWISLD